MMLMKEKEAKPDVLFITPPLYRLYGKMQASPPLGLLYLARYLNVNGIKAKVYNADYEGGSKRSATDITNNYEAYVKKLNDINEPEWNEVRRILRKYQPKIVGMSMVTSNYNSTINIIKIIKDELPNTKIYLGGVHATSLPEESAAIPCVDAVIMGEAEVTMLELAQGKDLKDVDGICYKEDGRIIKNKPRQLIQDLDSLPFPMLQDMVYEKNIKYSFSEMMTSRGCPWSCIFCGSPELWQKKTRLRSPENIYEEVKFRKKHYNTKELQFWDDVFTLIPQRTIKICNYLKELKVTWACQTRINSMNKELAQTMKDSGCNAVAFGVESGSQKILDTAKKDLQVENVKKVFKIMKEVGIVTNAYIIVGLPGETTETIQETVSLIEEIQPDGMVVSIATPLPGTAFYEMAKKEGWLRDTNWMNYFFVGRTDSVLDMPTISKEDLLKSYLNLQSMADEINSRTMRKKYLNPLYVLNHLNIKELFSPGLLWKKIKVYYYTVVAK